MNELLQKETIKIEDKGILDSIVREIGDIEE